MALPGGVLGGSHGRPRAKAYGHPPSAVWEVVGGLTTAPSQSAPCALCGTTWLCPDHPLQPCCRRPTGSQWSMTRLPGQRDYEQSMVYDQTPPKESVRVGGKASGSPTRAKMATALKFTMVKNLNHDKNLLPPPPQPWRAKCIGYFKVAPC